jgi:trehalose 6-phosphate synthase
VGWPGSAGFDPGEFQVDGIDQVAVPLSAEDEDGFYHGFSNATLWPLYHDGVRPPEFHRTWWASYVEVNRRFAGKAASIAGRGDLVWVHDYQLQ